MKKKYYFCVNPKNIIMKTFLINLYQVRKNIFFIWIFLFILSISDKSPNTIFERFLTSGIVSLGIITLTIFFIKLSERFK